MAAQTPRILRRKICICLFAGSTAREWMIARFARNEGGTGRPNKCKQFLAFSGRKLGRRIVCSTITCRVFQHVGSFKIEVSLPRLSTNAFSKNPKFSGMLHLLDLHVSPNFEGSRINICGGNPSWKCQISNVCDRVCVTMAAKAQIALFLFGKTISEHCSYIRLYSN